MFIIHNNFINNTVSDDAPNSKVLWSNCGRMEVLSTCTQVQSFRTHACKQSSCTQRPSSLTCAQTMNAHIHAFVCELF